jgi:zinc protease
LASYLSKGESALYKTLVEDKKTTDEVELSQYNSEIEQYILNVVAFDKTELNAVMTGINEAFKTLKAKVFRNRFRPN